MSRQTTLGRFGFEKSISHRTSVVETKVTDFVSTMPRTIECNVIIKLYCIYRCFDRKLYLSFSKSQLDIVIKYILV